MQAAAWHQDPSALQFLPPGGVHSDSNSSCSSSHGRSSPNDSSQQSPAGTSSLPPRDACAASAAGAAAGGAGTAAGAASSASVSALYAVNNHFVSWISQLYPTDQEVRRIKATLEAVQQVLHGRARGALWSVSALHPVGSFSRKTALRAS